MKLLQLLNEIEVRDTRFYKIKVDGETVIVAPEDLDREMNWYEATEACKKLDDGKWRLPTIEELEAMYKQLHKKGKGNFNRKKVESAWYWSSSQINSSSFARSVNFFGGFANYGGIESSSRTVGQVRPVRSPNSTI